MEAADDQPLLKFLEDVFMKLSDLDDWESSQTALFFKVYCWSSWLQQQKTCQVVCYWLNSTESLCFADYNLYFYAIWWLYFHHITAFTGSAGQISCQRRLKKVKSFLQPIHYSVLCGFTSVAAVMAAYLLASTTRLLYNSHPLTRAVGPLQVFVCRVVAVKKKKKKKKWNCSCESDLLARSCRIYNL